MSIKTYPNTEFPVQCTDLPETSVDVITCDKDGTLNIGYYNFDTQRWGFHTDTLVDYYEKGELKPFVWMYKPENLKV